MEEKFNNVESNRVLEAIKTFEEVVGDYNIDGVVDLRDILSILDDIERAKQIMTDVEKVVVDLLKEKIYGSVDVLKKMIDERRITAAEAEAYLDTAAKNNREPVKIDTELDDAGEKPRE